MLSKIDKIQEEAWEKVFPLVEVELMTAKARWEQRWTRHKFRLALMHGYLMVYCNPKIMGEHMPGHIGTLWRRGAIKDLNDEIEKLDDYLSDVADIMGRPVDGLDTNNPLY